MYRLAEAHAGLGAEAHGLVLALNLADSEGRVLVLPRRDAWCPPRSFFGAFGGECSTSRGELSWRALSWRSGTPWDRPCAAGAGAGSGKIESAGWEEMGRAG